MTELKNLELDLLFRIDFFALTNFGVDGYTDDRTFEEEKKALKKTFGFSHYYSREIQDYEYVRLSDLERDTQPYIKYLSLLDEKELFNCCQLEQAIGVFQSKNLRAFLSTDSGLCYNSRAHFDSVAEMLNNGTSDLDDINTFYGKVADNSIELLYSPRINNIDIDKTEENISMSIEMSDFELEFRKLKNRVNEFFGNLKSSLTSELIKPETKDFAHEVFQEIKTAFNAV